MAHDLFGAQAIPVVLPEETNAGEPAGPLEAVEIVEFPLLAVPEVLLDVEVVGQPIDALSQADVESAFAAVANRLALEVLETLISSRARPGSGWRSPRRSCWRSIACAWAYSPSRRRDSGKARSTLCDRAQTSGLIGMPASLAAFKPEEGVLRVGVVARIAALD